MRAPRTLIFLFVVPILFLLLYGYAVSQDINSVSVACVIEDRYTEARSLIEPLEHNPVFDYRGILNNVEEGEAMMRRNELNAVVVVRRGGVGLCVDGSNPIIGSAATVYLKAALNLSENKRDELFNTRMLYNPQLLSAYNFVPGIIGLIIISIFGLLTSSSIVRERVNGTLDIICISPLRTWQLIAAKTITFFMLSVAATAILLVLSVLLFDVPINGSIPALVIVLLLYNLITLLIGILISVITSSETNAFSAYNLFAETPALLLSGAMFPIENLPTFIQPVSEIVPTNWCCSALRKLMIQGQDISAVSNEILVMSIMTVILLSGSAYFLKKTI